MPASVSCRDTTHWSGSSAVGTTLPTSTTVPPLRTDSIASATVRGDPDRLERDVRSAAAGQRQQTIADVVAAGLDDVRRAHRRRAREPARAEVDGDDPLDAGLAQGGDDQEPDEPGADHEDRAGGGDRRPRDRVQRDRQRLRQRGLDHREPGRQPVERSAPGPRPAPRTPRRAATRPARRPARGGRRTGWSGPPCRRRTARSRRCCRT